ncbi:MAG: hypothetical protein WCL23_04475 [Candidatus Moraniibacteriota bacterium]
MPIFTRRSHGEYQLAKLMFEDSLKRNLYLHVDFTRIVVRGMEPGEYYCSYLPGPGQRAEGHVIIDASVGSVRIEAMVSLVGGEGFPSDACAVSSEIDYFDLSYDVPQPVFGLIDRIVVGIGEVIRSPFSWFCALCGGMKESVLVSDLITELEQISVPFVATDTVLEAADDLFHEMVNDKATIGRDEAGTGSRPTLLQQQFFPSCKA